MISCGIAWNGQKEGAHQWNKLPCILITDVELSASPLNIIRGWNHQVHLWLKRYVHERLVKPNERPTLKDTIFVFVLSALWHGFYPFYFFMMIYCGILGEVGKDIYKSRVLFEFIPKPLDFLLPWIGSWLIINYVGVSFLLFELELGANFSKATFYWVWIVLPLVCVAIKMSGLVTYAKKIEKSRKDKEAIEIQD